MSEAQEGCAWLEDIEESTFIRFSQFAYTGDYIAADPEILLDFSNIASALPEVPSINTFLPVAVEDPVPPTIAPDVEAQQVIDFESFPDDVWAGNLETKKKKTKVLKPTAFTSSSRKEKLWENFERAFDGRKPSKHSFHPRKNRESCEEYKEVFLCHARLYVFAEKYDIAPLKKLSLSKLHRTLSVFDLYEERVGDIFALMRYSYANTVHRSPLDDPLRLLIIHYAACVVEKLVPSSEFKALLEEPGELASDLVVKMIHRLDWMV